MDDTKILYMECECGSAEHAIRIQHDSGEPPQLRIFVQMNKWLPWWKRLVVSLKYVFKIKDDLCHWEDTLLSTKDAQKLRHLADDYIMEMNYPKG